LLTWRLGEKKLCDFARNIFNHFQSYVIEH